MGRPPAQISSIDRERALRHLSELVAALDRRVGHVERAGEAAVARDAAALRDKALKRISELERRKTKR